MRTILLTVIIIYSVLFYNRACAQNYAWARQFSTTSTTGGAAAKILVDAAGNVYSTGYFQGTMDFDPGPGVFYLSSGSSSARDGYVSKLDMNGNFVWAVSFGGNGDPYCESIALDDSGYVYVAGSFIGTVDFDPGPAVMNLVSYFQVEGDPFICKLSPTGGFTWVKTLKAEETDGAGGIVADNDGNTYTLLHLRNGQDIDPGPSIVNVDWGPHILKLDRNGSYVAHAALALSSGAVSIGLCLKNGFLHAVYRTSTSPIVSAISKLDTNLNIIWQVAEDTGVDPKGIAVDDGGNVIVSGQYTGTVDFDPGIGLDSHAALSPPGYNDMFFTKLDANGNFKWARTPGTTNEEVAADVSVDAAGDVYIAGTVLLPIYLEAGNPASYLEPQSQDFFNAKFDANGNFQWAIKVGDTGYDIAAAMTTDDYGNIYTTGNFMLSPDFNPDPAVTDTLRCNSSSGTLFVAKYSAVNRISGNLFVDANNDGLRQAGEINVPYVLLKATSGASTTYGITDSSGHYNMYAGTGSYTISIIHVPPYYTSSLATHTAVFPTNGGALDSSNDFPVHAISAINDLSVNCYELSAARPGRDFYMDVIYRNTGTTTLSGTVTLKHAPLVTYQQAVPPASAYTSPQISWNYTNLQPFETRSIRVLFTTAVNAVAGSTVLQQIATVNPIPNDSTPANNTNINNVRVTGSYDPNVKSVIPEGPVSPAFIAADSTFLSYCVRFQNTGTDTAFVVIISDTIQNALDLTSLKILGASHPFAVDIKPAGILKFTFNNIRLPDSTKNEPRSHGFVAYTLKPLGNLPVGTAIKNKAGIYFDFNDAVLTNETVNIVSNIVPVNLSEFSAYAPDCSRVMISWTTETETNNSMFIVERSYDGSAWLPIATINGAGNSIITKHYSYTDNTTLIGTVYYRLEQRNSNGVLSYSFIKRIDCNSKGHVRIYPNPVTENLFIETGSAFEYSLSDSKGALVKQGSCPNTAMLLKTNNLGKGVYSLILKTADGISRHRIIVL